jgi:hypothetical protein
VIGIVALLVLVTVPPAATSGDGEGVRSAQQAEEIPTDDAGGDGGGGGSEKDGDGGEHADGGGGKGNGDGQDADGRGGGGHGSPISSGADPTGASHKLPQRRSRRKRRPLKRARPRNQQILVSILTAWTGAGWMIETQSNDTAIDLWSGTSFHLIGPLLVAATVAHFEAPEVTPTLYSP